MVHVNETINERPKNELILLKVVAYTSILYFSNASTDKEETNFIQTGFFVLG